MKKKNPIKAQNLECFFKLKNALLNLLMFSNIIIYLLIKNFSRIEEMYN